MAHRAVVLLNVPKIIDAAHPVLALSTEEICKHLTPYGEHPAKPQNLERILDFRCFNGIFSKTVEEGEEDFKLKKYAHSPKSRCLSDNNLAETLLMFTSPELTKVWPHANKLVFNPDVPVVEVITGKGMYQYFADDAPDVHRMYVRALNRTAPQALKLLENYDKHFKALKGRVVDVAGQMGTLCAELASKYPHLQFVNFDLPEVVKEAPLIPGVEHVGGNFFDSVPQGNLLHLKFCSTGTTSAA
ncbi:hypothetical protein Mapa_008269 [Marchantia paleacea]|nr:hypothetical protein Mapa_008269 [Marchantia paleacea]